MTARIKMAWAIALPIIVTYGSVLCSASRADSLDFEQLPVSNVVAKLDRALGISIVISGANDPERPVTVIVADTLSAGARLDAVNQLANGLGLDFQKSYIVSNVADGSDTSGVRVDTTSHVIFPDETINAQAAIEKIGLLDAAIVHFLDPISGSVNLTDTDLQVQDAANQIATQTHTHWEAVYTLIPRSDAPTMFGKIVDRTNEGQPIVQLPFSSYFIPAPKTEPAPSTQQAAAIGQAPVAETATGTPVAGAPGTAAIAQTAASAQTLASQDATTNPYANTDGSLYTNPNANPYVNPYTAYYNAFNNPASGALSMSGGAQIWGGGSYNSTINSINNGSGAIIMSPSSATPF